MASIVLIGGLFVMMRRALCYRKATAGCHDAYRQSGFALIGVILLSAVIGLMMPMLLNLEAENRNAMRQHQSRAAAMAMAHHIYALAHDAYLTHSGLPLGWDKGSDMSLQQSKAITSCSQILSLSDQWQGADARISSMMIDASDNPHHGDHLIMGIARQAVPADINGDTYPQLAHVVMGCVITDRPFSQLAVIRGTYWHIGGMIISGGWQAGSS